MVVGLGTDLVELERMDAALRRHGERLLARLFTGPELAPLRQDAAGSRPGQWSARLVRRVAVRFAAKEAALKALGTGWGRGLGWHDVEVLGGRGRPPLLRLSARAESLLQRQGGTRALLSLSHTERQALATVVLC